MSLILRLDRRHLYVGVLPRRWARVDPSGSSLPELSQHPRDKERDYEEDADDDWNNDGSNGCSSTTSTETGHD